MTSSTFKRDVEDTSDHSSFSTTGSDSYENLNTFFQWRTLSQLTPASSPATSVTSYSSRATSLSRCFSRPSSSSSDKKATDPSEKVDASKRTYTRRIAKPPTDFKQAIQHRSPRVRTYQSAPSPAPPEPSRSPSFPLISLPSGVTLEGPRSRVSKRPTYRCASTPDQLSRENPNNVYTNRSPDGPDLSKIPHPVPDIIVTDWSLLSSAASRYAWSPRCLMYGQPYHNITDPHFLGRFSAGVGVNTPICQSVSFEMVDAELFAEMGGQSSVVMLSRKMLQSRVVASGCPSCACSCRGRGVAMARCWDLDEEEEEGTVDFSAQQPCRRRKVPVADRVEDARRMRDRIEKRREAMGIKSEGKKKEPNTNPCGGKVGVKRGLGRIRSVRRRKSKFIEVGCTPGNDLAGTSVVDASANNRAVVVKTDTGPTNRQDQRWPRKSWIKKLLHASLSV